MPIDAPQDSSSSQSILEALADVKEAMSVDEIIKVGAENREKIKVALKARQQQRME